MNLKEKQAAAKKVTLIGSAVDLLLGILKIITGSLFHSHALVIDGLHSLTDLVTDAFVLIIAKVSNEEPDDEHPYGHGRFETLGTVVLGAILIATGGALLFETVQRFVAGGSQELPSWPVFVVAIVSIAGKEIIFRYSKKVGEDLNSQLLIANAWHSRSDAITTIVVLFGAILTSFGVLYMDALASVVVSIFIGKVGWDFLYSSIKELVDTSLPDAQLAEVKKTILGVPGVLSMHDLRSRYHGNKAVLDVNIQVSPLITVSEGHEISSWVMKELMEGFDDIEDVTVHTDVEDDRSDAYQHSPLSLLPLRPTLEALVRENWEKIEEAPKLIEIQFHYLGGRVLVDLFLINEEINKDKSEALAANLRAALSSTNWFKDIRIWNSFQ
ncbi:MAG: cation diffusion facilitator family transporter [Bacteriovoracaceae bacterium]